jgi:hypothetical protein
MMFRKPRHDSFSFWVGSTLSEARLFPAAQGALHSKHKNKAQKEAGGATAAAAPTTTTTTKKQGTKCMRRPKPGDF